MNTATLDSLTQMEHAGSIVTFTNPPPSERMKISKQFEALRLQGHAIVSDVTIGNGEAEVYRVFHYLNCARCRKGVS